MERIAPHAIPLPDILTMVRLEVAPRAEDVLVAAVVEPKDERAHKKYIKFELTV